MRSSSAIPPCASLTAAASLRPGAAALSSIEPGPAGFDCPDIPPFDRRKATTLRVVAMSEIEPASSSVA
jgi:hypothetical protein